MILTAKGISGCPFFQHFFTIAEVPSPSFFPSSKISVKPCGAIANDSSLSIKSDTYPPLSRETSDV
jgi:hypothetical protein